VWDPVDAHPNNYRILKNSQEIKSGAWNSTSETIAISVDGLNMGVYSYVLEVSDDEGGTTTDEVIVTVTDGTPPIIDHPDDVIYVEGGSAVPIIWQPTDSYPESYQVLRNGTSIKTGQWNSSLETITINVENLGLGEYNYTIAVTDEGGNTVTDEVDVTVVDGTPPAVDQPDDFGYEGGTSGHLILWSPTDLHPDSYEAIIDGTLTESGGWDGSTISVTIDNLSLGLHNITLVVYDIGDNLAVSTVFVSVVDTTLPIVDHPPDVEYEAGTQGNVVTWNPTDFDPDSFQMFLDSVLLSSGDWSGLQVVANIDGLDPGVHNCTLVVYDGSGYSASDTVYVTVVDTTPPSVDHPSDIQYSEGETGNSIIWTPADIYPGIYEILRNGSVMRSGGWDESITIPIDNLLPGGYNYTIVVYDESGNYATDTVLVRVMPGPAELPLTLIAEIASVVVAGGTGLAGGASWYRRRKRKATE
jgi:hypothetical protein